MEGNRVYLAACPDYGQAEAKLREAVAALGGMERFVRPGERILLKANLLRAAPPESAICTHPAVAAAAAKLVAEAGGTAVITDSPGGALHKEAVLRGLYEKTGMAQAAAASGAELCYDASTRTVSLPAGRVLKQAEVIAPVAEADGVFDLPKLKTHVLMSMTGAVKNLFGVLPGLSKVGYHATHPSQEQFADVLLDLAEYVRPRLSIMDGCWPWRGTAPAPPAPPGTPECCWCPTVPWPWTRRPPPSSDCLWPPIRFCWPRSAGACGPATLRRWSCWASRWRPCGWTTTASPAASRAT